MAAPGWHVKALEFAAFIKISKAWETRFNTRSIVRITVSLRATKSVSSLGRSGGEKKGKERESSPSPLPFPTPVTLGAPGELARRLDNCLFGMLVVFSFTLFTTWGWTKTLLSSFITYSLANSYDRLTWVRLMRISTAQSSWFWEMTRESSTSDLTQLPVRRMALYLLGSARQPTLRRYKTLDECQWSHITE